MVHQTRIRGQSPRQDLPSRAEAFAQYATAGDGGAHVNGDHPPERTSWWPVDLGSVLAGDWRRPEPTIGKRRDGRGLFYKGKSHLVVGETESAKTWFTLAAAWDEILAGNHVVFIDFEDDEGTIVDRLRATAPPFDLIRGEYQTDQVIKQYFHYIRPEGSLRVRANVEDLAEVMHRPRHQKQRRPRPVRHRRRPQTQRRLRRRLSPGEPPTIRCRSHRPLHNPDQQRQARPATPPRAAVDRRPARLRRSSHGITRPRPRRNHHLAPKEKDDTPERPTRLMAKIVELLAASGTLSQRRILAGVSGNTGSKRDALDLLILDGYVSDKTPHELTKPWQEQET